MKELLGVSDIIVGTWENVKRHHRAYLSFVVWYAGLSVLQWVLLVVTNTLIPDKIFRGVTYFLASLPISLVYAIVGIAILHMASVTLQGKPANPRASLGEAMHKIIPFIWVTLLVGMLLVLGFFAFVIPFIWLAVALNYAVNYTVVDDVRGWAAVSASKRLVEGRWWATMWRMIIPAIFFSIAAMFVTQLSLLVFGAFFGDPSLFFQDVAAIGAYTNTQLLVTTVVPQVISGIMLPLFVCADLILWFDLKAKR